MGEIEQKYGELKKKHTLPDFADLDKEFEISKLEKPAFLLREIRDLISERMHDLSHVLEPWVQPDVNAFTTIFEYRTLNESERREVFAQFKKLMALRRACLDAELAVDDVQDAALITRAMNEWPGIRKALRPIIQKIMAAWPKPSERQEVVGYFG
jgi:hypothetical protein